MSLYPEDVDGSKILVYWPDFKALVSNKGLQMQYVLISYFTTGVLDTYLIWANESMIQYQCYIVLPAYSASYPSFPAYYTQAQNDIDYADFIANYQSTGNAAATTAVSLPAGTSFPTTPALPVTANLSSLSVSISPGGDNTLIAGVSGQTIRVFKLFLVFSTATTATFKDGPSITLDGALPMSAGGSIVLDLDSEPWFVTSTGNAFILNLGSAGLVAGRVYYTQS